MDWTMIITGVLGLGVTGDIVLRILFRSERQKAAATAQAEENQMWHDRLSEIREANKDLNTIVSNLTEANKQLQSDNRELNERFQESTRDYEGRITRYERVIAAKDKLISWLRIWHCRREQNQLPDGCGRRLPQQEIPVTYTPPKEFRDILQKEQTQISNLLEYEHPETWQPGPGCEDPATIPSSGR